jgi:succinate dehydrogenase/fumarate reductase flavoprotein subunit
MTPDTSRGPRSTSTADTRWSESEIAQEGALAAELTTDVLIIGSGAAGLTCAVAARQRGSRVVVAGKGSIGRGGSTAKAGGIVNAALAIADPTDSPEEHVRDTVAAARFLSEERQTWAMAEGIVRELPRLLECGVAFVRGEDGRLVQTRQAGHRRPRTLVLVNNRGLDLADPLVRTARSLGIDYLGGQTAVEILVDGGEAAGAAFLEARGGEVTVVQAKTVVLATGGAGLFYESTGIPALTPGDGYALALQAGCTLIDLEFVQFYPVSLAEPEFPPGHVPYDYALNRGAVLRNSLGENVVAKHHLPEPSMITRAMLAGAIGREIAAGNTVDGCVLLDCTRFTPDFADPFFSRHRLAGLIQRTRAEGRDILARPLRVRPMVHHFMGGVRVDLHGETDVPGLLACGEVAGGTHGANRLAANAFTEAISSGFRAGEHAADRGSLATARDLSAPRRRIVDRLRERLERKADSRVDDVVRELRRILATGAGTCREERSLREALERLGALAEPSATAEARDVAERGTAPNLPGLVDVARRIVAAALARQESRGAHVRSDFVEEDDRFLRHFGHRAASLEPFEVPVTRSGLTWPAGAESEPPQMTSVTTDSE